MPQEMKSYCKNVLNFMGHYYTQEGEGSGEHQQAGLATTNSFFLIPFLNKKGKYFSIPFLPATPSFPSRTLEGLLELTQRPSRALDSPCALLPELQRYKDTGVPP